ncbi:MAG: 30S ribosomal protein S9 [Candidatus Pacebacteria bacterium]|nr:30S ribosomal protein S9 [Candidatus Paceibacterota bacterium]
MTQKTLKGQYTEAIGRRKSSTARVRIYSNEKESFLINDKNLTEYFPTITLQEKVLEPLKKTNTLNKFCFSVHVNGGGMTGQADAIKLGVARVIKQILPDLKPTLKNEGLLTRDARKVERKKPGLHKARRAPQWRKR